MTQETVFSQIIKGEIPCDEVYSDEQCLAFRDIQPQAPVHILIIPRKPLKSIKDAEVEDKEMLGHLLLVSAQIAQQEGLKDWRTIINTGSEAGQTVFHLHIHVIGGRKLTWPPG
ncbi:histidine triad nucleotide-binding protein [Prochlorococcus marinus]|uniref:histidine triad nucleotide-binding protein n=1 Tax=Prochlorococcus marinus TaxID=1219 RepID=UPI0022B4A4D5|nr:histidine triad nucleotide-binding protein [Prochlorococcus marinus]